MNDDVVKVGKNFRPVSIRMIGKVTNYISLFVKVFMLLFVTPVNSFCSFEGRLVVRPCR